MKNTIYRDALFVLCTGILCGGTLAQESATAIYRSTTEFCFETQPAFKEQIRSVLSNLRDWVKKAKSNDKYVAYLSVPISTRGGGYFDVNNEIAQSTAKHLIESFGDRLYIVNPAAYDLEKVEGKGAGGGDYMAIWSDLIGGSDGAGDVFDMVYFAGPSDIDRYFGLTPGDKLGKLDAWIERRKATDPSFAEHIEKDSNRRAFVRYYGIRASSAYSQGANDEWNIIARINAKKPTGEDIAVYFDGQPIEPGDFGDSAPVGNAVECR